MRRVEQHETCPSWAKAVARLSKTPDPNLLPYTMFGVLEFQKERKITAFAEEQKCARICTNRFARILFYFIFLNMVNWPKLTCIEINASEFCKNPHFEKPHYGFHSCTFRTPKRGTGASHGHRKQLPRMLHQVMTNYWFNVEMLQPLENKSWSQQRAPRGIAERRL